MTSGVAACMCVSVNGIVRKNGSYPSAECFEDAFIHVSVLYTYVTCGSLGARKDPVRPGVNRGDQVRLVSLI